jgi:hypothetical protein
MNPEVLLRVFDQPVAFHRCLVSITGSVNAALLLGQLIYWTPRANDKNGWVYKTSDELEEEVGLSRHEQATARRNLRERGLVVEEKKGVPPNIYFMVDVVVLKMALEVAFGGETPRQPAKKSNCANPANQLRRSAKSIVQIRKNNTKNTDIDSTSTPRFNLGPAGVHIWTPADRLAADQLIKKYGLDVVTSVVNEMEVDPLPNRVKYQLDKLSRAQRAAEKRNCKTKPPPKAHLDIDFAAQAAGAALLQKIRQKNHKIKEPKNEKNHHR